MLWERVGERTELQHIDPHSYGHNSISFPFSWAAQPGCWFSLPHLISNSSWLQLTWSNWLNFLCTELYNSSTPTFFLWASQIALIQPIHGQGYILIFLDRMHLLFTLVHFLFWQPNRVGGQQTTICLHSVQISKSSIWPIHRVLSCAITSGQSRPGSNGNKGLLHIPISSLIIRLFSVWSEDIHWAGVLPTAEIQSAYSAASANCVKYMYEKVWALNNHKELICH